MLKVIEVVFDGKAFVPTEPVVLPAGTKGQVSLPAGVERPATPMTREEAERILQGDGSPLPWATVDEAMAYIRGRPWPEIDDGDQP
jgi:predicted DNA-binding antitoxin AbrB/MazE fold protein